MAMKYDQDGLHHWAPRRKLGGGWVCFKSSPKAPQAPDPVVTANAQSQSNIDTANAQAALNRNNQYTPWGSQEWTQGPKNADGTSQWSSTIKLDPSQQQLLDSSNQISQLMAQLGIKQAGQVGSALDKPIDYNGLPQVQNNPLQTGVAPGALQQAPTNTGQALNIIANSGGIQRGINTGGTEDLTRNVQYGTIKNNLGVSGEALAGAMKDSQGAAYNQQKAYLDADYGQRQRDLENQLVQQGVLQGSDAWNRAVEGLGRQRTFDYNNAFNNSFDKGLAANNQLFGQDLASSNFANSAQAQGFSQGMQNAQLNNSAAGQLNAQRLAQMMAGNAAQGQQFGQNLSAGQFANAAQQQNYSQAMNNAAFNNNNQSTMFSQGLANAGLNNQASGQAFGQSSSARAQALQELLQQQQNPINILNALRSGSQVSAPTFGNTPQGNVANTDIASMYNNQYQGQLAQYNSQQASNNSGLGSLVGLGGAALMSPAGTFAPLMAMFSDRRLKKNVRRVGTHALGIGLYTYDYLWGEPGAGVMADELEQVMPEAVSVHPSGFKMVNYGML